MDISGKDSIQNMQTLSVLQNLCRNDQKDQIKTIPTLSHRKSSAIRCLNELLRENPQMTNTIYALVSYSTQKWAQQVRNSIGLDLEKNILLEDSFQNAANTLASISTRSDIRARTSETRLIRLAESDRILDVMEEAIDDIAEMPDSGYKLANALKAVHFMNGEEDITPFAFQRYYRESVMFLDYCFGEAINEHVCQLTSSRWLYEGNTRSDAYHNTVLLIKIYSRLICRYRKRSENDSLSDHGIQRDTDGLVLLKTFEDAVNGLRTYRDDGELLYQIIRSSAEGKIDREIKEQLCLSTRAYVKNKALATNLLSFILWGYSTMEIFDGIAAYPITGAELKMLEKKNIDQDDITT